MYVLLLINLNLMSYYSDLYFELNSDTSSKLNTFLI